jgi:NitT/TauT family transport system substrate-binding protein
VSSEERFSFQLDVSRAERDEYRDVTLVNGTLGIGALVRGDIDAAMTIPPVLGGVQSKLGDNAMSWPAQNDQPFFSLVLGEREWIAQHPDVVERFLAAMSEAEDYIAEHPTEAKALLKRRLKFSDADIERVWAQNDFSLSLDQSLIVAMEAGRWMIKNGLTSAKGVPDFVDRVRTVSKP